jgi:hypothetical protein
MAITDLKVSEELMTSAPSIKYRGNEGPKSPQEEQMIMEQQMMEMDQIKNQEAGDEEIKVADALLKDEYLKYVFEMEEQGLQPMSFRKFRDQVLAEAQMSKGPILPSPEDPINPFTPKPQGPVLPDRQMAAYGGIMGMDGRRQYGIGSSLKKFVRKVIPNEIAEVAVKAAPFVAPFNPLAAGLMSGIGGFDQTGRIGSSLKSGLMNYALGQAARGIGGAGMQEGFNLKINPNATGLGQYFSSPMAAKTAIGQGVSGSDKALFTSDKAMRPDLGLVEVPGKGVESIANLSQGQGIDKISPLKRLSNKIMEYIPTSFGDLKDPKKLLGAVGIGGALAAASGMGTAEETVSEIMDRGEGLDLDSIRLEVREAFKDSSGQKLAALRNKYPYLGTQASKNTAIMANGGRIGFNNGGGIMDLGGMEKDYRNTGGFVDIGEYEKKR